MLLNPGPPPRPTFGECRHTKGKRDDFSLTKINEAGSSVQHDERRQRRYRAKHKDMDDPFPNECHDTPLEANLRMGSCRPRGFPSQIIYFKFKATAVCYVPSREPIRSRF
jgi:hypothetical protein